VYRFNEVLRPPVIANGFTCRHNAVAQHGIANELLGPQLLKQFLARHGAIAVLHEVGEHIKHLGLDLEPVPGAAKLITLRIELIIPKGVDHRLPFSCYGGMAIMVALIITNLHTECPFLKKSSRNFQEILKLFSAKGGTLLSAAAQPVEKEAVLWNAADPSKALEWQETQGAAQTLGVTLHAVETHWPDDADRALAAVAAERPDALIVFEEKET
jgi:hypothetical protein